MVEETCVVTTQNGCLSDSRFAWLYVAIEKRQKSSLSFLISIEAVDRVLTQGKFTYLGSPSSFGYNYPKLEGLMRT